MKSRSYAPLRDEAARLFSKSKVPIPWPSMPVIVPHRFRRKLRSKLRSRQSPTSNIAALQTSLSPSDTLRSLKLHKWSYYDGQYLLLAIVAIFALSIIQSPGPFVKTLFAAALMTSLILPITRQFFLPFLPIASWLLFWFSCQYVLPNTQRSLNICLHSQVHNGRLPASYLGKSFTGPGEHLLRSKFEQHFVCT